MRTDNSENTAQHSRRGGDEAVCFTAGPAGAAFGAGVVHAWLASDRNPPTVVAGISMGALTSAAMQRSYRDLESCATEGELEAARWRWFRRYLDAISNDPLEFIWRSIPDPVDFFADKPPVRDLSANTLPADMRGAENADDSSQITEPNARRHYHILTKLGIWLGRLPLEVRTVARILMHYVRWKEGYGFPRLQWFAFLANAARAAAAVVWHLASNPTFFSEASFGSKLYLRPLFGWRVWLAGLILIVVTICTVSAALAFCLKVVLSIYELSGYILLALAIPLGLASAVFLLRPTSDAQDEEKALPKLLAVVRRITAEGAWTLGRHFAEQLDISRGLLHSYALKRRLFELFGTETLAPQAEGTHLVLVCAALEHTKQVWLKPTVRVIDALTAALAIPAIFAPVRFPRADLSTHKKLEESPRWTVGGYVDLIDGVAVRSNPVPSLFTWCKANRQTVELLDPPFEKKQAFDNTPRLHVVYNVPIESEPKSGRRQALEHVDIVESARTALLLEQRRDTRQEVRQTNFLSKLEGYRRLATGKNDSIRLLADEIAPERTISFVNDLEPTREECLRLVAEGCRRTLQVLYREDILELVNGRTFVHCASLLQRVAGRRAGKFDVCGGVPELCSRCTGKLVAVPNPDPDLPAAGVVRSYGKHTSYGVKRRPALPADMFEHLRQRTPRIAFLGSGGVFRGAFHIGVIGALHITRAYPDLVVGASVGALMGGALANIAVSDDKDGDAVLGELASVFLHVDGRVALTETLKNALKQLGTRASDIRLSPDEVRRMVVAGARADAGFASTGAPPALIDAIAQLFVIPHRETIDIASDFIGGKFAAATSRFLSAIRRNTLDNLRVRYAFMGTSLLRGVADELLGRQQGRDLRVVQPYHQPRVGKAPVSFFCTTSLLNERISLLLGRDFLTATSSYDFVEATLSSSAFPVVFSPRSEAQVVPGLGRTDRLFADGGMFDNLPVFPAIEILSDAQWEASLEDNHVFLQLKRRHHESDVLLAASLNVEPNDAAGPWNTIGKIRHRAQSLSVASKIDSFVSVADQSRNAVKDIVENQGTLMAVIPESQKPELLAFLNSVVCAKLVKIVPTDEDHINGTFAFCRSAGLRQETVQRSIADGCFRTLLQMYRDLTAGADEPAFMKQRETPIEVGRLGILNDLKVHESECPWFKLGEERLKCPFARAQFESEIRKIRVVCAKDSMHGAEIART